MYITHFILYWVNYNLNHFCKYAKTETKLAQNWCANVPFRASFKLKKTQKILVGRCASLPWLRSKNKYIFLIPNSSPLFQGMYIWVFQIIFMYFIFLISLSIVFVVNSQINILVISVFILCRKCIFILHNYFINFKQL